MEYLIKINGVVGEWPNLAETIQPTLTANKGKHIDVTMTSPGGSLFEALAIRDLFEEHGDVTVHVKGYAASAATIISMGAKNVTISKYGQFLIHQCSNWVDEWGRMNQEELKEAIKRLTKNLEENQKLDQVIATIYADRTGKEMSEIHDIMSKNTWLSAREALDLKLVDEIEESSAKSNISDEEKLLFEKCNIEVPNKFNSDLVDSEESLASRIVNGIVERIAPNFISKSNNITKMERKPISCATLAALLNVENVESVDGKITLTEAQITDIENALAASKKSAKDNQEQIEILNSQLADLQKENEALKAAPSKEPDQVLDEGEGEGSMSIAQIQNMINGVTNY